MRRLYFRAGDFHSAGRRGCRAAQQKRGRWRGNFKQGQEYSNPKDSSGARERVSSNCWGAIGMPENGKRKSGEKARMGLQIDAMKEIEELKSEISTESSAAAEPMSEADSIGISLIDLAEIPDQHKIWVESGGESGIKADLCGVNLAK